MTFLSRRAALGVLASAAGSTSLAASAFAQATFDIPIGAIYPMSGPSAIIGANANNAMRAANEIVDGDYDLDLPLARADHLPAIPGARLRYIMADHKSDPATARAEAQRLISAEKVVAIVGCGDDQIAEVLSDICDKAGVPFVDTDSTSMALRQRTFGFSYRFAADEATRAGVLFDFFDKLRDERKADVKAIALFHGKEPEDIVNAKLIRAMAEERKIRISAEIPHERGRPDIASASAQKMRTQTDVLLLLGAPSDAAAIAAQMTGGSKDAPIIAYPSKSTDRLNAPIDAAARGLFIMNGFARDAHDNDANIAAINTLYRSLSHKDLDELSALQFTAFLTLAVAINDARGAGPGVIAQKLSAARLSGDRTVMPWEQQIFNTAGNNKGAGIVVTQRQKEKTVTVFPPRFASGVAQWRA